MRTNYLRVAVLVLPIVIAAGMPPSIAAQATDSRQDLEHLSMLTSLDREGLPPWHLRMSFQLNDLHGSKKESGTIEEWWSTPKNYRIAIASPSYNVTIPNTSGQSNPHSREAYLVNLLLRQVTHPIPSFGTFENLTASKETRKFGKTTLECMSVQRSISGNVHYGADWPEMCVEPGTASLRIYFDSGGFSDIRNRPGNFMNTNVALDNTINYAGKVAIAGHVDSLETYHPDASTVEQEGAGGTEQNVPGIVQSGRILTKAQPIYPELAKREHLSGTVILSAQISKQGAISSVDVVASPDDSLSRAALDAVRQWTYEPYLLNGKPTEVDTVLTVNFRLSGG